MSIKNTQDWFREAVPNPDNRTLAVQLGCHAEEIAEMLEAMETSTIGVMHNKSAIYRIVKSMVSQFADMLKGGREQVDGTDQLDMLDALCDQIVTAVGVGYMLGFDMDGALKEVMRSNYSKFENGKPVFNEQGKIAKGRDYTPPQLEPYL